MLNFLITVSTFVALATAATCPAGESFGSCALVTLACAPGYTCVDKDGPTPECCPDALVPTTVATTTVAGTGTTVAVTGTTIAGQTTITSGTGTTVSSSCRDLLNTRTGISDCPMRANLCNDSVYYDVMTRQCPRTCNRCSSNSTTTSSSTCADRLNPRTGVSDCPARAALCNDSTYYDVMTVQCPKTCNRCTGTATSSATTVSSATTTGSTTCVDQVNNATGVSDCPARAYLCNNSAYYTFMTTQCPRTCGRCTSG